MCTTFKKYELPLKLGPERSYKSLEESWWNMYILAFQKLNYGNNFTSDFPLKSNFNLTCNICKGKERGEGGEGGSKEIFLWLFNL